MADMKTEATTNAVDAFLAGVIDPVRRADATALVDMLSRVSGAPATMWGSSIIGFGRYHYRYDSGREGDMCRIGFSPRKAETVLYVMDGFPRYEALLARLGKHRTGKSCLYIKRLANIDQAVLEELAAASLDHMRSAYP